MEYLTWDCSGKLRVPDAKEIGCPKHISFLCDFTLVCISNNNTAVCENVEMTVIGHHRLLICYVYHMCHCMLG